MKPEWKILNNYEIVIGLIISIVLYLTSGYDFLLFHVLVEIFIIIVAGMLFMITWFSRKTIRNNYLLFLGISYLFISILELFHTLVYKGMGFFPTQSADLTTQLWVSARYLEAVTFLIAPLMIKKEVKAPSILLVYALVTTILITLIFTGIFLLYALLMVLSLQHKILSEYLISFMMFGALGTLWRERKQFDTLILNQLIISIAFKILAELTFTLYTGASGFFNVLGTFLNYSPPIYYIKQ